MAGLATDYLSRKRKLLDEEVDRIAEKVSQETAELRWQEAGLELPEPLIGTPQGIQETDIEDIRKTIQGMASELKPAYWGEGKQGEIAFADRPDNIVRGEQITSTGQITPYPAPPVRQFQNLEVGISEGEPPVHKPLSDADVNKIAETVKRQTPKMMVSAMPGAIGPTPEMTAQAGLVPWDIPEGQEHPGITTGEIVPRETKPVKSAGERAYEAIVHSPLVNKWVEWEKTRPKGEEGAITPEGFVEFMGYVSHLDLLNLGRGIREVKEGYQEGNRGKMFWGLMDEAFRIPLAGTILKLGKMGIGALRSAARQKLIAQGVEREAATRAANEITREAEKVTAQQVVKEPIVTPAPKAQMKPEGLKKMEVPPAEPLFPAPEVTPKPLTSLDKQIQEAMNDYNIAKGPGKAGAKERLDKLLFKRRETEIKPVKEAAPSKVAPEGHLAREIEKAGAELTLARETKSPKLPEIEQRLNKLQDKRDAEIRAAPAEAVQVKSPLDKVQLKSEHPPELAPGETWADYGWEKPEFVGKGYHGNLPLLQVVSPSGEVWEYSHNTHGWAKSMWVKTKEGKYINTLAEKIEKAAPSAQRAQAKLAKDWSGAPIQKEFKGTHDALVAQSKATKLKTSLGDFFNIHVIPKPKSGSRSWLDSETGEIFVSKTEDIGHEILHVLEQNNIIKPGLIDIFKKELSALPEAAQSAIRKGKGWDDVLADVFGKITLGKTASNFPKTAKELSKYKEWVHQIRTKSLKAAPAEAPPIAPKPTPKPTGPMPEKVLERAGIKAVEEVTPSKPPLRKYNSNRGQYEATSAGTSIKYNSRPDWRRKFKDAKDVGTAEGKTVWWFKNKLWINEESGAGSWGEMLEIYAEEVVRWNKTKFAYDVQGKIKPIKPKAIDTSLPYYEPEAKGAPSIKPTETTLASGITPEDIKKSFGPLYKKFIEPKVTRRIEEAKAAKEPFVGELPKYAGKGVRINLSKQDIPVMAKHMEMAAAEGIEKTTIPWAQTEKEAIEILNDIPRLDKVRKNLEVGKGANTSEHLAVRMQNANKFKAAHKKLVSGELSGEQFKKLMDEIAFQPGAAEVIAPSEAGRTLRIYGRTESGIINANQILKKIRDMGLPKHKIEQLAKLDPSDYNALRDFYHTLRPDPKLMDYIYELWYNAILSGLPTHVVNATGNTAFYLAEIAHRPVAATIDMLIHPFNKEARNYFASEIIPMMTKSITSQGKGAKGAGRLMIGREAGMGTKWAKEMGTSLGAWENAPSAFVRKYVAPVVTMPSRALRGMDFWAQTVAGDAELAAIIRRAGLKKGLKGKQLQEFIEKASLSPTKEWIDQATAFKQYVTFTNDPGVVANTVAKMRDVTPGGRFVIPFVRTIANLTYRGMEWVPGVGLLPRLRRGPAANYLAKQAEGAIVAYFVMNKVAKGEITAGAPESKTERDAFYRAGKQPWAMKFGDQWFQYRRVEPLNQPIALTAIGYEKILKAKDEDQATDIFMGIAKEWKNNLIDGSYLAGVSRLFDRYQKQDKMLQEHLASLIPYSGFMRSLVRAVEAYETGSAKVKEKEGFKATIKSAIPGLSRDVPNKLNIWGEEITLEGGILRQWLPYKWSTETDDPLEKEFARLEIYPGPPQDKFTWNKKDYELSEKEHRDYMIMFGREAKMALDKFIATDVYRKTQKTEHFSEDERKTIKIGQRLNEVRDRMTKRMRHEYFKSHPRKQAE